MGCSASKQQSGRDVRNAPLTRSMSLPDSRINLDGDSSSKCASGSGKSEKRSGHHLASSPHTRSFCKLKSVKEEDDYYKCYSSKSKRSVPFGELPEDSDMKGKCSQGSENLRTLGSASGSRTPSFSFMDAMEGNSGLRLLLIPLSIPSKSFTSSTRHGVLSKVLSSGGWVPPNEQHDCKGMPDARNSPIYREYPSEIEGMGDSEQPSIPLFDPAILATFERAVEASVDDSYSSDATSTGSSRIMCSLDTSSDADSPDWRKENGSSTAGKRASGLQLQFSENPCKIVTVSSGRKVAIDSFGHKNIGALKKKSFSSKVSPLMNDAWLEKDYLESFEVKCPPGCEDKIVLYFTSLRGIRKTFEDCCTLKLILKGYGVQVDERDVWMHAKFRDELIAVVGAVVNVPRLFVKGRYIGGVEDVKYLHEEGILENLVEGVPAESNMCDMCCGIRFIPCTFCNGSRKLVLSREVYRCPDCNENGLMMCPSCRW